MSGETAAAFVAPAYRPDPSVPGRTTGGLEERWINGEHAVAHGGDTFGYSAQMVLLPGRHTGFFLASNVESDEFREDWLQAIFDRYYPPFPSRARFVDLDPDALARSPAPIGGPDSPGARPTRSWR